MKKMSETIVFFGSGPVAAKSLRLLAQDFAIEAVITKPRPPHHTGDVPVLTVAGELSLPVLTATDKQSLDKLFSRKPVHSQVAVLIDFGIIISQAVINYFPLGIINSHFSLLPEWRGADPITFSILSGQAQTGISLMLLVPKMDEGPLLAQAVYDLPNSLTTPELTDRLIELSNATLKEVLPRYINNTIQPFTQDIHEKPTYSRKLTKQDGVIDWHKDAIRLEREIRAYASWPKSKTTIGSIEVVITKAHVVPNPQKLPMGDICIYQKAFAIVCGKDMLVIDALKPAGKKEMSSEAFLAGYGKKLFKKH